MRARRDMARDSLCEVETLLEKSLFDDASARTQRAVQAILGYLAQHPLAADTEQGIAQWWLPQMGVDVPLADVQQALQALLLSAKVLRIVLPDGRAIYRAPSP